MLSLARSRYTLSLQLAFLAANACGVVVATVYNANTPDLYPNNAHHKLGWLVTWAMGAQVLIGLLGRVVGIFRNGKLENGEPRHAFTPISQEAMAEHHRLNESRFPSVYRNFNDHSQGTEPTTESFRSQTLSTTVDEEAARPLYNVHKGYAEDEQDDALEVLPALPTSKKSQSLFWKAPGMISSKAWKVLIFGYDFVDRTSLILGFITLCTGIIAYARLFVSSRPFSAHFLSLFLTNL